MAKQRKRGRWLNTLRNLPDEFEMIRYRLRDNEVQEMKIKMITITLRSRIWVCNMLSRVTLTLLYAFGGVLIIVSYRGLYRFLK